MARNFCRVCELELKNVFFNEFNKYYPLKDIKEYSLCLRCYQDEDGTIMTCLARLNKALTKYVNSTACHRDLKEVYETLPVDPTKCGGQ